MRGGFEMRLIGLLAVVIAFQANSAGMCQEPRGVETQFPPPRESAESLQDLEVGPQVDEMTTAPISSRILAQNVLREPEEAPLRDAAPVPRGSRVAGRTR